MACKLSTTNVDLNLSLPPNLLLLDKIKVGAVSYLNTKPLLYGIRRHGVLKKMELMEDYPSNIAQRLLDGTIDLGLVPVAIIPKLKEAHLVTDYCIGSDGPVASVCLFSEVPVWEIEKVYLDYQSRTSVRLAQLLLKEHWRKEVEYIDATGDDYRRNINGRTAGVVIGDRALEQRAISTYCYDLGEAWKEHTGLPFVFAAWVANKELPDAFVSQFNEANALGLKNIKNVLAENTFPKYDLKFYYTQNMSYLLDAKKRTGLKTFLKMLKNDA
jgi:chorismate dehydratase